LIFARIAAQSFTQSQQPARRTLMTDATYAYLTVWTVPLWLNTTSLDLPEGARVLTVQMQGDTPCLLVLVNPDARVVSYAVAIMGAGNIGPPSLASLPYAGTFQVSGLAWHVFIGQENTDD
jgi:hypothetical protein